jgi:hypothetical protein
MHVNIRFDFDTIEAFFSDFSIIDCPCLKQSHQMHDLLIVGKAHRCFTV